MASNHVNSATYWDARFAEDWEKAGGPDQTRFFGNLALRHLPVWLRNEIRTARLSICDWGCAEGDAVDLLHAAFPESEMTGIDVAREAIARARSRYPGHRFGTLDELGKEFAADVVFCSNTLEHFDEPLEMLRQMLEHARKHAIVLVPFQETPRIQEHLATFDYNSFPLVLGAFHLVHFCPVECASLPGTRWNGEQLMVVFSRADQLDLEQYRLLALVQPLIDRLAELRQRLFAVERLLAESNRSLDLERARVEAGRAFLAVQQNSLAQRLARRSKALLRRLPGAPWLRDRLRSS